MDILEDFYPIVYFKNNNSFASLEDSFLAKNVQLMSSLVKIYS